LPNISGKWDTPFSFYLPHPQTFSNNSLLLSEEKRIFAKEKLHWAICKQAFIALAGIICAARSDTLQPWRYDFFRYGLTNP